MQNREEWENSSRSETILVIYDHETKNAAPAFFGGGKSYQRAIAYRNKQQKEKPNFSFALIANEAAAVEYGHYMLGLVGESPDVPENPEEHYH